MFRNSECSQEGHELIVRRVLKEAKRGQVKALKALQRKTRVPQ
jgi:hypothetical protein